MSLRFLKKRRRRTPFILVGIVGILFITCLGLLLICSSEDEEIVIGGDKVTVKVLNHQTGELMELGLEEYVAGVVAAEMPASFHSEALKAQAVAARTYVVKRLLVPDPRVTNLNRIANISTNPAINQAWVSTAEMKKRWGKWNYSTNKKKIVRAVEETKGKVLIYKGQPIDPAYHASCGGKSTEDSGEVWKYSVPYLRAVSCTGHADRHQAVTMYFDYKAFDASLGTNLASVPVATINKGKDILKVGKTSNTGRIRAMLVRGKTVSGAELRSKLGLPSTRFNWKLEEKGISFETNGYGHGVGMCQYGAADMAKKGKNYEEILKHYYTGVQMAGIK